MHNLFINSKVEILPKIQQRAGEHKLGKKVHFIESVEKWTEEIQSHNSTFVVFGIAEDIGVRANFGRAGTSAAWDSFLESFVNIQHNSLCKGSWITLLGALDVADEMGKASRLNPHIQSDRHELFELVSLIDQKIQLVIRQIILSDKIPVIIGGGHNNAYGNIKGLSTAKGEAVGAVNFDAHTDFRPLEGRHSGNGFSYALNEGYLDNYFIFGLHENYLSDEMENSINNSLDKVKFNTYEAIAVRKETSFDAAIQNAEKHVTAKPFGLEIDLDSLPMIGSSAFTPSGFSLTELRQFIHHFAKNKNAAYLHICEGAPPLACDKNPNLIGKLIAYLVTDFIKSKMKHS